MSINREAMQLWVNALRSGEYTQGQSALKDDSGRYCCLGVACEVAMANGVPLIVKDNDTGKCADKDCACMGRNTFDGEGGYLPPRVSGWLGVAGSNVILLNELNSETTASAANDVYGWSFETIADAIERTYLNPSHDNQLGAALTLAVAA